MGIELITSEGKTEINKENFAESLQKLENMLEPGTPVMFQKYSSNNIPMGGGKSTQRILLLSGGNLSSNGVFNLESGKRNFSYLNLNKDDSNVYQVVHHWKKELDNHKLNIPHSWTFDQYNENTFSAGPGYSWKSSHSAGTEKIVVGNILEEQFPDAMNELRFSRDAFYFKLDQFYSMQNYLITEIGDKRFGPEEQQRARLTSRIACLRACMNLINEAEHELGEYTGRNVVAEQVGWFFEGTKRFRKRGHPVNDQDYLVHELSHPMRNLAFVKPSKGIMYGEMYVLPFNEKVEHILELA